MTQEKERKRSQYMAAEQYVVSFYERSSPPYDERELTETMVAVKTLAPDVANLNQTWLQRMLERLSQRRPERHVKLRAQDEWEALFPRYPTLDDGFVVSFDPWEHNQIKTMLHKFGLVVVKAFSPNVCQATIEAMFDEINQLSAEKAVKNGTSPPVKVHPDHSWTWEDGNWPSERKFLISRPAFHPQAFANRTAPHIYELFAALWGEERLRVSIDNWGVTRGTHNLLLLQNMSEHGKGMAVADRPKWGQGISPHWDYNPWLWIKETEHQGRNPGYQTVVALNEHSPGMGCHQTLPGGTAFLKRWCQEHGCPPTVNLKRTSHRPPTDDPIRNYLQEIPLRQGEMILWTWGQLHATAVNTSNKMRLHQYIRFFPARETGDPFYEEHDRYAPQRVLRQYDHPDWPACSLSLLGRRLVGLEEWPSEPEKKIH